VAPHVVWSNDNLLFWIGEGEEVKIWMELKAQSYVTEIKLTIYIIICLFE
jgi:hypothetical protein